jgi:hypothetical protein
MPPLFKNVSDIVKTMKNTEKPFLQENKLGIGYTRIAGTY